MAPNAPDGYYSIPRTVALRQPSPLARAIEAYLADIKRDEDSKSPFYKEVLCQLSNIALHDDSAQQSQVAAKALSAFIEDMDFRKRRDSKMIRFGERLRPLVTGLSQFTTVADIAIQASPAAAVILYSGARLVLQLAENAYKCFDTVLDIMANIGTLLRCYELYSTAYQDSEDIQNLLFKSYKNIVGFWQKAARLLSRKSYKSVLTGLLKPLDKEWQECRDNLERDCSRVRHLGQATGAELQRQRDLKHGQIRRIEERRQLVEWLKGGEDNDVRIDLRTHLDRHHAHTGAWLYEDSTFRSWIDADENRTLWYHAVPGSGKTVTSSILVRHLQDRGLKVAYFFCSFNDLSRRKSITALRSLALQILTQTDTVPDQVMKLYEADVANHIFALRDLETATMVLQAFLTKLPSHLPRLHIVLDGLDECQDGGQMRRSLCRLMSTDTYAIVKWFFTSRNESEIQIMARQLGTAEIEPSPTAVIGDIKRYLQDRTTGEEYSICCIDGWADASEGNFLWMSLMLDILVGMDLTCEEEIDEELNKFPSGLTGCYLRSLEQLSTRSKQHQELARRIFTILVVAEQPLHLSELSNCLGIRDGAEDYLAKSIPKLTLIEDLCSHLVIFDRISKGNEKDPILKLAHKSVQDFFLQDPNSLDIPIPVGLRKYFVNLEVANLEMGKACLTYLSYSRYLAPLRDLKLLDENDHAFLKYAATFWFWHLIRTNHSQELFTSVEQFIRSPAFWTCLIVQSKAAPHLFAQLVETRSGRFRLGAGKLVGSEKLSDQKLNFAFPLPDWLDQYSPSGPVIIQEFLRFIKEWHSVLTSYPEALCQCIRDFSGNAYPCCNPSQPKGMLIVRLSSPDATRDTSWASLRMFGMKGNIIQATVLEQTQGPQRKVIARQICVDMCSVPSVKISREVVFERAITTTLNTCHLYTSIGSITGDVSLWESDLSTLSMIRDNGLEVDTFAAPGEMEKFKSTPEYDPHTPWIMVSGPSINSYTASLSAFHYYKPAVRKENENDSGYDSPSSASSSDEDSADELDKECSPITYHFISLASHNYAPLWFAWQSNLRAHLQVICATHPTEPIALWSHTAYEFRLGDLRSGNIKTGIFQEPVDIQIRSASALRREMHFSSNGSTLYYLLCSLSDNTEGSVCSVTVSSFEFSGNTDDLEDSLRRSGPSQHVTYRISKSAREVSPTFILTHWTEKYLYIALPILSSKPKIVRLALNSLAEQDTSGFQTLQNPLYFPASTHCRNPQLCIRTLADPSSTDSDAPLEQLILALDSDVTSTTNEQSTTGISSPTLMIWSISESNVWRDWSKESDERSSELETSHRMYEMLRGSFVDSEQRFSIPIRSGLDWTKKAFVSCA